MNLKSITSIREQLLNFYDIALTAVDAHIAVIKALQRKPLVASRIWCIAIGKAAVSMAQGADEVLQSKIEQGLIITKDGSNDSNHYLNKSFEILTAGHPTPDSRSVTAGEKLVSLIQSAPKEITFLFLISGGASALVERLPDELTIADLQHTNEWLLANAVPINQMNVIRKSLSCIKGGRLAQSVYPHYVRQLVISDVPGDVLEDIGSGLLVPTTRQITLAVPTWLHSLQSYAPIAPQVSDKVFCGIETEIIANNTMATQAVLDAATQQGIVVQHHGMLTGDAVAMGKTIAHSICQGDAGLYIYGGETVMSLPSNPGLGGRCQSLALAAAMEIRDKTGIAILAASTDGTDGPTEIAGALVDGFTCQRGEVDGISASASLKAADAGTFLLASGDAIDTGSTGTNVMDLVIALKHA